MENSEEMRERFIPENVLQGKRILGFKKRNLIEGLIMALIMAYLISYVPFVSKVGNIITICVGLFLFFLNAIGIKGQSLTQVFLHFLSYRKFTRQYSYRRLHDANETNEPIIVDGKVRTVSENRASQNIKKIIGK